MQNNPMKTDSVNLIQLTVNLEFSMYDILCTMQDKSQQLQSVPSKGYKKWTL